MVAARTACVVAVVFVACATAPSLPEGSAPGLVAHDPAAPASTQVWDRPQWRVGDRHVLLHGGRIKTEFVVTAADEQGYVLTSQAGGRMRRGLDLSHLGEWPATGDLPVHALTPYDARYHWPLWVGKRWRCQYSDRAAGGVPLPIEAAYEVEGVDTIEVPAGTFSALRILRTARLLAADAAYLDRVMVVWYAPDIGLEVRQVLGDSSIELAEWTKAK